MAAREGDGPLGHSRRAADHLRCAVVGRQRGHRARLGGLVVPVGPLGDLSCLGGDSHRYGDAVYTRTSS